MQTEPRILFADDDADTCEMIQLLLERAGFRVSIASSPVEVLRRLAHERFDAILLDNWMPGQTGVDVCRQIRTTDQTTPILFCSGAITKRDVEEAKGAGAQAYIGKPFDPDELVITIRRALSAV